MRRVFADTGYWVALARPGDQWKDAARRAQEALGVHELVTTDEVVTEFLAAMSRLNPHLRRLAARFVRRLLASTVATVIPQSRDSFLHGLALYERRPDKAYSLTDCISMETMRKLGLTDVLTNDRHFGACPIRS
ncbi:MAG: type II toxin-antitoxin system VapC family toxin [Armatimonadetes bacterium]|nr:type II toxin-antitoxin system VapC family toxin [Armatimonadota bacterium]